MAENGDTEKTKITEVENGNANPVAAGKQNLTFSLLFVIFAAVVGSAFQHGYNTGVVNAPQESIKKWICGLTQNCTMPSNENDPVKDPTVTIILATIVSIFCFGGMLGGLMAGVVSETIGRKWGIILNNVFVFVSAALMGLAKSFGSYRMLIAGRFFIGINAGLNAGLIPMYISEVAPLNLRGMLGSSYQLIITISILLSQILGLKGVLGNVDGWPMLFSLIVVPAVLQLITMPFCVESPKYLWSKGKEQAASEALQWLRNTKEVQAELDTIKSESDAQNAAGEVSLKQMFTNSTLRIPLIISVVVMLAQQLSGINAVIFYSTNIFTQAKLSDNASQIGTITMGSMNVVMTVISSVLVEAAGRRTLLLIGFGGMLVDTILLTIVLALVSSSGSVVLSYTCIALIVGFVVIFAVGPGSIPWFLVSELFMQNARPIATSIAVAVNWLANFLVGLGFPIFQELLGNYVFIIFIVLQLIFTIFIYKKVPETKNKTPEEISVFFRKISYE